jgi:hypothetical protein
VAVDGIGNLLIADTFNNRIRMVTPGGVITTVTGNGTYGYSGDGGPATSATLNYPSSVAVDAAGNLFIADSGNNVIRQVDPTGAITTVAGTGTSGYSGDGGPATSAELAYPEGVAVDGADNLFVADSGNQRIRMVTPGGVITTVAGNGTSGYAGDGGPATSASLTYPGGIAADPAGDLLIADTFNYRIRLVPGVASSVGYTISGQATLSGSGLGGVAITLSGSASSTATTNGSGNYGFTVPAGGGYMVTPSLAGYTFTPPNQSFPNLGGNQTASFIASPVVSTYTISGQATLSGSGLGGVAITLSGSASSTATTNGSGNYGFTVPAGGGYMVTPSLAGCTFTPPNQSFPNLGGNQSAPFSCQPQTAIVSPLPGITLSGSLADFSWSAVSGATEYQLSVGTTPGGTNIFSGTATGTSQPVGSIPCADTVAGTIYVQIAAEVNGTYQPAADATYQCESGLGDFNGDGYQDLVWQNNSTGQVTVHYYDGTQGATYTGWNWLNGTGEPSGWVLVGAADFDGNGVPDLVWEYMPTGQVTVNYYGGPGGTMLLGWNWLNESGAPGWTVVAVADMDGNGVPDLIWQNNATSQVTVDYYGGTGGTTLLGWNWLNEAGEPEGWQVVAAADFDGNGTPDLVWEYVPTRQVTVNYYGGAGGATYQGWNWLNSAGDPGWTVVGAADFNGDGVPDLVWQNDATAQVTVNYYGGVGGATLTGWNWLAEVGYPGWTAVVPR